MDFAQQLVDAIPICLFVLDKDLTLLYMNSHLSRAVEYIKGKIDEQFIKGLTKVGIRNLSYDAFVSAVNRITAMQGGTIETIKTGRYAFITLAPITVLLKGEQKNTVLVIIRGERK